MATQIPFGGAGTYPLSEVQIDRFSFKIRVGYPSVSEEREIISRIDELEAPQITARAEPGDILGEIEKVKKVHISERVKEYIVDLEGMKLRMWPLTRRGNKAFLIMVGCLGWAALFLDPFLAAIGMGILGFILYDYRKAKGVARRLEELIKINSDKLQVVLVAGEEKSVQVSLEVATDLPLRLSSPLEEIDLLVEPATSFELRRLLKGIKEETVQRVLEFETEVMKAKVGEVWRFLTQFSHQH